MQKNSKLRFGVVAAVAVAALAFSAAAPAYADPTPDGTIKPLAGVGSDTTENVTNGIATVVPNIGSYDATGSAQIQTKTGGVSFDRPNGSTRGQIALTAAILGGTNTWPVSGGANVSGQIDFARSSSGPKATLPGSDLTFIPFAKDGFTFAVNAASDFPRDIPQGSASQDSVSPAPFTLRNIYRSVVTSYLDKNFNAVTIRPLLPKASGTRDYWVLTAMGLVESGSGVALGSSVTDLGGTVQEHDGSFATGAGDILPFSVGQYLQQANARTLPTVVVERRGTIELGKVGTIKPYILGANGIQANANFPINRLVYNVVGTSRLSGTSAGDLLLQSTFAGSGSDVCGTAAAAQIKAYGLSSIGSLCGNTSSYKQAFRFN